MRPSSLARANSTNKWYQRDMITGRRLLSDHRRRTIGEGENFSNPAKSLSESRHLKTLAPLFVTTIGVLFRTSQCDASDDDQNVVAAVYRQPWLRLRAMVTVPAASETTL